MLKRFAVSAVIGAALFGALTSGLLARHRELRGAALEVLKLDVGILVGE